MLGYDAILNQCACGLMVYKKRIPLGPARKQTRIRTTKYHFAIGISHKCKCKRRGGGTSPHVPLMGLGAQLTQMQNYHVKMCKRAALLIVVTNREMLDLPEGGDDDVYALEEAMDDFEKIEMKELLKDLRGKFDLVTVRAVVKLHEQFACVSGLFRQGGKF